MEQEFWHKKWEKNEIAFHERETNPLLVKHFKELALEKGDRVFLPLCGKTLDIHWFISSGFKVVGAELSEVAIGQLFAELGVKPAITRVENLNHYSAENIEIFVGDIFDLSLPLLGKVDAIYDRAALVALPNEIRERYATHLIEITSKAKQLLICYEYDQSLQAGPPFSVSHADVSNYYSAYYELILMETMNLPDGLKRFPAKENVWLLKEN